MSPRPAADPPAQATQATQAKATRPTRPNQATRPIRPPRFIRRASTNERGMAAIELTLLAPVLLLVLLFVVGLGRMAHARQQVEAAAADSARAASLERNPTMSRAAAAQAASRSLGDGGLSCTDMDLQLDLSGLEQGGTVTAVVRCRASLGDVALSGLPGSRTFTATSRVPIETYRSR